MSYIKIEVPNDDHIALRAFGKALEEMALAHGAPLQLKINEEALNKALDKLQQAAPRMMQELRCEGEELQGKRKEPEIDTTAQQVESPATHVITSQEKDGDPVYMGNGNISQGYRVDVEELSTTDKTGTPWDERIHSASKALNADGTWRLRRKPKQMDEKEWAMYVEEVATAVKNGYPNEPLEIYGADDVEPPVTVTPVMTDEEVKAFDDVEQPVTLEDAVNASIEAVHTSIAQEFGTGIANAAFTGDRNEPPVTPPGDDFHTDAGVVSEQTVAGIPPIPVPPPVPEFDDGIPFPPSSKISPALERLVEVTEQWTFPKLMTFLTERQGKIDVATVNMLLAQDGIASLPELNAHPDKIGPFVARVKAHLGE